MKVSTSDDLTVNDTNCVGDARYREHETQVFIDNGLASSSSVPVPVAVRKRFVVSTYALKPAYSRDSDIIQRFPLLIYH